MGHLVCSTLLALPPGLVVPDIVDGSASLRVGLEVDAPVEVWNCLSELKDADVV